MQTTELFTPRELEVLNLKMNGYSNKVIAARLFISIEGVKAHVANMLDRHNCKNMVQLVARYLRGELK